MLADDVERQRCIGKLCSDIVPKEVSISAVIWFVGNELASWRDDPKRPVETSETQLTKQVCAWLNSVARHAPGWDILQFRREEPDETDGRRTIDLAVAPCGAIIWIEGREYSHYSNILPIECKRLPTPVGGRRDEREYLFSDFSSTGGVHRFKAGHHGASHARAAMIGYLQSHDIAHWRGQLDNWIDGIVTAGTERWSAADKLQLVNHDTATRFAALHSKHVRLPGLDPIRIDHLWIEMLPLPSAQL